MIDFSYGVPRISHAWFYPLDDIYFFCQVALTPCNHAVMASVFAGVAVRGGGGLGGVCSLCNPSKSCWRGMSYHTGALRATRWMATRWMDTMRCSTTRYDGRQGDPTGKGWGPRKLRLVPDGHNESNYRPKCRAKSSGMTTGVDTAGVNLARHKSGHGQKT